MMGIYCSWGMTCHLQCSVSATVTFLGNFITWSAARLSNVVTPPLDSWPSSSVFAYCKRSKTGGIEGLGMRLHLPTESVSLEPLSVLCSAQFPTHGCMSRDFPTHNWVIMWLPHKTGSSCDNRLYTSSASPLLILLLQAMIILWTKLSLVYTRSCTKWGAAAIFVSEPRPVNIFCWGLQERCDPSSQRQ